MFGRIFLIIRPGDDWQQEIRTTLDTAQAAVLLISADFFAFFIDQSELPPLLAAAQDKRVRVLPLILSASRFARDRNLARFQSTLATDLRTRCQRGGAGKST